jgi:calcineurin-like phosphoesterase family protein
VVKKLIRLLATPPVDAVVLVGDLTSLAEMREYESFLDELRTWVGESSLLKVHIVPGNHDVDRHLHDDEDPYLKFNPLREALAQKGFQVLPTEATQLRDVGRDGCLAQFVSLNSCLYCGALRYLNPFQVPRVARKARRMVRSGVRRMFEELDTPAFPESQLSSVFDLLTDGEDNVLRVLIAHHNLLPQVTPRFAPYAELLDGGMARAKFMEANRPLLYLHGHTHAYRVEVLNSPARRDGRIVSIGAPSLPEGFNEVEVQFNETGYPIGCKILRWKLEDSLELRCYQERVPLWNEGLSSRRHMSGSSRALFDDLPKTFRLPDLANAAGSLERAADLLLELEWFGVVRLTREEGANPELWSGGRTAS